MVLKRVLCSSAAISIGTQEFKSCDTRSPMLARSAKPTGGDCSRVGSSIKICPCGAADVCGDSDIGEAHEG